MLGSAAAAIAVILTMVFVVRGNPQGSVLPGDLVTTFQPGELQQVPDACAIIPATTMREYLPGKVKIAAPLPVDGKLGSGCNWSVDRPPMYRLVELHILAYAPSLLVNGNGSATNAAKSAYAQQLQTMRSPGKHSFSAKAAEVSALAGLGNEAFRALQVFHAGGATTDVATVVVRFHNVIVTATAEGLIARTAKGVYGPVDTSQLTAAALAFAQAAAAALH